MKNLLIIVAITMIGCSQLDPVEPSIDPESNSTSSYVDYILDIKQVDISDLPSEIDSDFTPSTDSVPVRSDTVLRVSDIADVNVYWPPLN